MDLTIYFLATMNMILFAFLVALVTGVMKFKIELAMPQMQLAPVQLNVVQPRGYIESRRVKGVPAREVNRFTRAYSPLGWSVSLVELGKNGGELDVTLSRFVQS